MAVWLVRVLDGEDPGGSGSSRFADVDAAVWWSPFVERLADLGVTAGCATGPARFCPRDSVSRAQMATFLTRAFGLVSGPDAGVRRCWEQLFMRLGSTRWLLRVSPRVVLPVRPGSAPIGM